ncbi:MAG: M48 family metallopeptidase [Alphaproteobacteria bacterium]
MTSYPGSYNDGRSAARREVVVHLDLGGLRILDSEGREIDRWPYDELHLLDEERTGRALRLKCGETGLARLSVADRRLLDDLSECARAPQAARAARPRIGLWRALWLGLAGLAILVAVVWVALPRLAGWTAARIPVSWEEALGQRAFEELTEVFAAVRDDAPKFCETEAGRAALDRLVARLAVPAAAQVAAPYRFQITVLDIEMANAFALPGGRVVLFRGLIEKAGDASEVAGVLAHEMGHVTHRHGTQAILRGLGLEVLFGLMLGDLGEGLFGDIGTTLMSLSYSREAEAEADRVALALLDQTGIGTQGLAAFFDRLAETDGDPPSALQLLSTHPSHEARARLFARAEGAEGPAMSKADWAALKGMCGG